MLNKNEKFKYLNQNSIEIFCLLLRKIITLSDIYDFLSTDSTKEIKELNQSLTFNLKKYYKKFSKLNCIDLVLEDNDKYKHLKELRELVNMDDIIDKIIGDNTYEKTIRLLYTKELLKKIKPRDALVNDYSIILDNKYKKCLNYISKEIDNYYLNIITN